MGVPDLNSCARLPLFLSIILCALAALFVTGAGTIGIGTFGGCSLGGGTLPANSLRAAERVSRGARRVLCLSNLLKASCEARRPGDLLLCVLPLCPLCLRSEFSAFPRPRFLRVFLRLLLLLLRLKVAIYYLIRFYLLELFFECFFLCKINNFFYEIPI